MWQCLLALAKVAPIFSAVASAFTAVVATVGVCVALTQLRRNQNNQRETTAKNVFREYLKLAFDNPEFARPDYRNLVQTPEKLEAYAWFVAYLLWACEEMLRFATKDEIWQKNLQLNVNYHREYFLNDSEFMTRDFLVYDSAVQKLVLATVGKD